MLPCRGGVRPMNKWKGRTVNAMNKYRILLVAMMVPMVFFVSGCGGGSSSDSSEETPLSERKWTYMVYMAADNNLSACAAMDINEMESVGSGDDVNIVVQVEFSPAYNREYSGNTLRGRITRDEDSEVINSDFVDIGSQDMTDPQTLSDFIAWAAENYPAQHYALTVWSHGDGWKTYASSVVSKGLITDDSDGSVDLMSVQNFADGVLSSGVDLDLINFDACLMGMYEVAYELSGLAGVLTFSEEEYPGYGDAYDLVLQDLTASPDMDGQELAQVITTESVGYYEYLYETYDEYEIYAIKSAVDMSYIEELHNELCSLAGIMIDSMDSEGSNIQAARDSSVSYYAVANHDLGDFLDKLADSTGNTELEAAIQQVQGTMSSLIISNEVFSSATDDEILGSQGLAVYLPTRAQAGDDLSEYSDLSCNQGESSTWADFVTALLEYGRTSP